MVLKINKSTEVWVYNNNGVCEHVIYGGTHRVESATFDGTYIAIQRYDGGANHYVVLYDPNTYRQVRMFYV